MRSMNVCSARHRFDRIIENGKEQFVKFQHAFIHHLTAPSASSGWRPLLLSVLYWLLQLPYWLLSSDPALFLPPKKKKHSHSHSHSHATSPHAHNGSSGSLRRRSLDRYGSSGGGTAEQNGPTAAAASSGPISTSVNDIGSASNVVLATPVAPPQPFLSPHSFPIPSAKLNNAAAYYNLGSSLLSTGLNPAAGTRSTAPPLGSRPSIGQEATSMYQQHVQKKKKKKKYTLVLDLDETLVHTTDRCVPQYDCRVEIHTKRAHRVFYILKRPFLDVFLVTLSQYFEIVIFTASIRRYADAVIDLIDLHHVVDRRFFRQSCIKSGNSFLKDLHVVNSDLRKVLILDNSPVAYSLQEENAIPIPTWYDDPTDTVLRDLIPFILSLRSMDDVRSLLHRRKLRARLGQLREASPPAPQLSKASTIIEEDENAEEENGEGESTTNALNSAAKRNMRSTT